MRTKQSYQINFLSLLNKVTRLGNERNKKDQYYARAHTRTRIHTHTHTHTHTGLVNLDSMKMTELNHSWHKQMAYSVHSYKECNLCSIVGKCCPGIEYRL